MKTIANLYITDPLTEDGDGIQCFGEGEMFTVDNCVVDFSGHPVRVLDEAFSTIHGAEVIVRNCTFRGAGKLVLCGNGDYPENDKFGSVVFQNCTFENFGRRGVEAQDGVTVTMRNCTIKNWGVEDRFDVRSFASWAHSGAYITCIDCTFIQDRFWQMSFWNFLVDIANSIGNDINDKCLSWKSFLPGVCKGLFATNGGKVRCVNCRKNKWWIYLGS